jgi:hypothetical protein
MGREMDLKSVLPRIGNSRFRARFRLDRDDLKYIDRIGYGRLREHALELVRERLGKASPVNDGKQTPFRGHPVFKAQHATATCCRGCLNKWYSIPRGRPLSEGECRKISGLLIDWIRYNTSGV